MLLSHFVWMEAQTFADVYCGWIRVDQVMLLPPIVGYSRLFGDDAGVLMFAKSLSNAVGCTAADFIGGYKHLIDY